MKRLYFIAKDLQTLLQAKAGIEGLNDQDMDLHVWGRNREVLVTHDLRPLDAVSQSDVVHSGEQGALMGCVAGMVLGAILMVAEPFGLETGFLPFVFVTILFTLFGSWLGGLVGVSSDNYQLERFHEQVDAGYYIMQLDVAQNALDNTVAHLARQAPELVYSGETDAWDNPLRGSFVKHVPHGHVNVR